MRRLPLFVLPVVLSLISCIPQERHFSSSDCTAPIQAQFTRIYIGMPSPGGQQSGTSAADPLDATTVDKFDTILRTIAEGQRPTWGTQSQIPPENLIVCIGSGVFHTNGQYDWVIGAGHTQGAGNLGFAVGKNWHIHGQGTHQTMLQLDSFVTGQFKDSAGNPFMGGTNTVIGTYSDDASGVEVSDLTINANHDNLNRASGLPLNLDAIVLRSFQGGHWIHDVNVVGASGDLGTKSVIYETFPVRIGGDSQNHDPSESQGNLIEHVRLSRPGHATAEDGPLTGALTAIAVDNAGAEVRNNVVDGYFIAYGGWNMQSVWFHDNVGINNHYGLNVDSFSNLGVVFESNRIINPSAYGIVMGGGVPQQRFAGWKVSNNTIELDSQNSVGMVLHGQVQGAIFSGNKILSGHSGLKGAEAIWSYDAATGVANVGNIFQDNQFDSNLRIDFSQDPDFNTNCRFQNRDLSGRPRSDFPDNSGGPSGCSNFAVSSR